MPTALRRVGAIPRDTNRSAVTDAVYQLALEYAAVRRHNSVEWIYVQQPRNGELQYETFSYVPEHHFRRAYDRLTERSDSGDSVPDGGRPIDEGNDHVWFWYNPSIDCIVQEEVEPYDVRGVFATEDDAEQFLDWYADQYGVADTSHLELYRAELTLEGFGRKYLDEESERSEGPPEQVDFDTFDAEPADTTEDEGDPYSGR